MVELNVKSPRVGEQDPNFEGVSHIWHFQYLSSIFFRKIRILESKLFFLGAFDPMVPMVPIDPHILQLTLNSR